MGTQQTHPKLKDINTITDIKQQINSFNNLNQDQLEKDLNAQITFKNTIKLIEQKVKEAVITGTIKVQKAQYPIQMSLCNFLQLYDMISNLINERNSQSQVASKKAEEQHVCCTCLDLKANRMLPCSHCFCQICMEKYILQKSEKLCPICRADFTDKDGIREKIADIYQNEEVLELLIIDIKELLIKTNPKLKNVLVKKN